jgi:hypothetical protein
LFDLKRREQELTQPDVLGFFCATLSHLKQLAEHHSHIYPVSQGCIFLLELLYELFSEFELSLRLPLCQCLNLKLRR